MVQIISTIGIFGCLIFSGYLIKLYMAYEERMKDKELELEKLKMEHEKSEKSKEDESL